MRKVRAIIMASAKMQQKDTRARVWLGSKALTVKSVMHRPNYVIIISMPMYGLVLHLHASLIRPQKQH